MHPVLQQTAFGVVELRQYAMVPGARDTLIDLFEREFVEAQEARGMVPVGHYRDLDDPNSFVWFRGFAGMETRRDALDAFYTSPTWLAHRNEANATLIDSDNVLLLRPARPGSGFDVRGMTRPGGAQRENAAGSFVAVSVLMLDAPASSELIGAFEDAVLPALQAERIAYFVTEERPNDFPRLPVREGEHAFAVTGICPTRRDLDAWVRLVETRLPDAAGDSAKKLETLRLEPASRSLFR